MDRIVGVRANPKPALVLILPVLAAVLLGSATIAQSPESVDLDAITRIKEEGFERSQVMDTAWWLTERYGPRLTNSPQMRAAADWAVKRLTSWGLANVKQEPWGSEFGRGWSNERTVVLVTKPSPWPGIVAVLDPGAGRGDSGSLLVGSGGSRNAKDPPVPPAAFVYHTANREQLLPRKPLPRPTAPARPSTSQEQQ